MYRVEILAFHNLYNKISYSYATSFTSGSYMLKPWVEIEMSEDRNVLAPDTPVGVQDGSSVNRSGAASTKVEPVNEFRRYRLRRRPRKKRDPQFIYSEDLLGQRPMI